MNALKLIRAVLACAAFAAPMAGCDSESATPDGEHLAGGAGGGGGGGIRETGYLICMPPGGDACLEALACEAPDGEVDCVETEDLCEGQPSCDCVGDVVCRQGRVCVDQADGSMACADPDPDPEVRCPILNEADCAEDAECLGYYGYPYPEACAPEANPDALRFVACGYDDPTAGACAEQVKCAAGEAGVFGFPACTPPGYGVCPPVDMCEGVEACEGLDEDVCEAAAGCYPYRAYVEGEAELSFVACGLTPEGCDDVLTCATNGEGVAAVFPDSCVAPGWDELDGLACAGGSGCAEHDAAACDIDPACQPVQGASLCHDGPPSFQGCIEIQECPIPDERVCAYDPTTGEVAEFGDACVPEGWLREECDGRLCNGEICSGLSEEVCNENPVCQPVMGRALCADGVPVFQGCITEQVCPEPDQRICGVDPESGRTVEFGDACLPLGWAQVNCNDNICSCEDLDEATCEANEGCRPIHGAPAAEVCSDDTGNWQSIYAGCTFAERGCGDAETCGEDPRALADPLVFPDTCLPEGWVPCDLEAICAE